MPRFAALVTSVNYYRLTAEYTNLWELAREER